MARKDPPIEEKVVYARERGDSYFQIKAELGVPVSRARSIIKTLAPHLAHNTLAVRHSWQAVIRHKRGVPPPRIGRELGISKNTAVRAIQIGLKSWDRRGMDIKNL